MNDHQGWWILYRFCPSYSSSRLETKALITICRDWWTGTAALACLHLSSAGREECAAFANSGWLSCESKGQSRAAPWKRSSTAQSRHYHSAIPFAYPAFASCSSFAIRDLRRRPACYSTSESSFQSRPTVQSGASAPRVDCAGLALSADPACCPL